MKITWEIIKSTVRKTAETQYLRTLSKCGFKTKPATARASRECSSVTSASKKFLIAPCLIGIRKSGSALAEPLFFFRADRAGQNGSFPLRLYHFFVSSSFSSACIRRSSFSVSACFFKISVTLSKMSSIIISVFRLTL